MIAMQPGDEAAYRECVTWLDQIMRASPQIRTASKLQLWQRAQDRWGASLHYYRFLEARREAMQISGAKAWAMGGGPADRRSALA